MLRGSFSSRWRHYSFTLPPLLFSLTRSAGVVGAHDIMFGFSWRSSGYAILYRPNKTKDRAGSKHTRRPFINRPILLATWLGAGASSACYSQAPYKGKEADLPLVAGCGCRGVMTNSRGGIVIMIAEILLIAPQWDCGVLEEKGSPT